MQLSLTIEPEGDARSVEVDQLVIAGWTGRDVEALERHIKELEELGVARPPAVPCFYRVGCDNLTTADSIQCLGDASSGEVEFVLIGTEDGMLVAVGSDHTDRKVETYSVPVSKQMCAKPVSARAWRYDDVADHFDALLLRAWIGTGDARELYQDGSAAAMRPPGELIARYLDGAPTLPAGTAMFGGTLAAIGGIRTAARFEFEIRDPVLDRSISHGYSINCLPIT